MDENPACIDSHHYWVIGEPNGHTSDGFCKNCNAHRVFRNWLPEFEYAGREESRVLGASASGGTATGGRAWR